MEQHDFFVQDFKLLDEDRAVLLFRFSNGADLPVYIILNVTAYTRALQSTVHSTLATVVGLKACLNG